MAPRDFCERLLSAMATATAYTASILGITTTTIAAANGGRMALGAFRGAMLEIAGTGGNNYTLAFKVWRVVRVWNQAYYRSTGAQGANTPYFRRVLVGTGTATLSSSLAAPSAIFGASAYFADAITFTIDAEFQNLIDTIGGGKTIVQAFTPASGDTVPAHLAVSDFFDASDFEVEFDLDGGSGTQATGGNVLVFLTR